MGFWDWGWGPGWRRMSGIIDRFRLDGTGYVELGMRNTNAGIRIDRDVALTSATFYACMNLIGGTIATLGFEVMQRNRDGSRVSLDSHPVNQVIRYEPTLHNTACEFWQKFVWDQELSGNAYALISRNASGEVIGFVPWEPDCVTVDANDPAAWVYRVKKPVGGDDPFNERDRKGNFQVFHLRNVSIDGKMGLPTPDLARNALGLDLATEKYGAMFFGRGGRVKDIFKVDAQVTPEQRDKFKAIFQSEYGNNDASHGAMLLERGWDRIGSSGATPNEAQFLETQTANAVKVCRFVGVPPTMVGILDRATFSNNEQLMLQFVTLGLANRIERIEQAARRVLFTADEKRKGLYIHSRVNKLMRGDSIARGTYYKTMMSLGAMNANEVRDLEDMPRIVDDSANEYRRAQNIFGPEDSGAAGADPATQDIGRTAA
jgi:HK97 family phage portal protein